MANNIIQVKRTSTSGRTPNTSDPANTQYISAGELALNMTDGILYTSNGSALIEVGANNTSQNISTNNLTVGNTLYVVANGNVGISTSSPNAKLTVTGTANVSGNVVIGGSLSVANLTSSGLITATSFRASNDARFGTNSGYTTYIIGNGIDTIATQGSFVGLKSDVVFGWGSGSPSNPDAALVREAADTIAQRRSTNAQTKRIYGTFTDASNYERLSLSANSTAAYVQAQEAGTGIARDLYIGANNTTNMIVAANGNIGVNTTSPTQILTVNGSILVTNTSSFIGVGTSTHGALYNRKLSLDDGTEIVVAGAWFGSNGFRYNTGNGHEFRIGTSSIFAIRSTGVGVGITAPTANFTVANSTTATAAHIYGTYTDASNYERVNLTANATGHYVFGERAGTGSSRPLFLGANNNTLMTIAANGNIGIGNTAPPYPLSVFSGGEGIRIFPNNTAHRLRLFSGEGGNFISGDYDANQTFEIKFDPAVANGTTGGLKFSYGTRGSTVNDAQFPASLQFSPRGLLSTTPVLYLNRVGNIGINTAFPTEKLQVEGNAIINGNVTIGKTTNTNCVFTLNNDIEIATNKVAATTANTQTVISTFSIDKYRGGKFTILGKLANDTHITEVLLTHNFTNVFYTEYGVVFTNTSLYTVSSSIVSNNVQIVLTSASSDIHYDIMENKFIDIGVYDRSQTITLDRSGSIIETRAD